jgi:transposase
MAHHQATRDYVARRIAQGRTKMEIIRCLKRYVARQLYPLIHDTLAHLLTSEGCRSDVPIGSRRG